MSSQEAVIKPEEKKFVNVLGIEVPKVVVKLVIVAIAAYALFYLYKKYGQETISLSASVPITVPTVESITPPEVRAISGPAK